MSTYMTIILIVCMGVLLVALGYTWSLTKAHKAVKGELDSQVPEVVQQHAYLRNPIFLTYLIFFAVLLLIIVIFATTTSW